MATGKVEDIFEKNFMTAAKFSVEIENIVKEGDLNYIAAIVQFCEDKNIEILDSHHHFWDLDKNYYPFLCDAIDPDFFLGNYEMIRQNYLPADYEKDIKNHNVIGSIHCEAEWDRNDQVGETKWIENLAKKNKYPNAIIGHAWFHTKNTEKIIAEQASFNMVKSIRSKPNVKFAKNSTYYQYDGSMQDTNWRKGLKLLEKYNLNYDLRVPTWHLEEAVEIVRLIPNTKVIINHCGFPWDRSVDGMEFWRKGIKSLSLEPNTFIKLSEFGVKGEEWNFNENATIIYELIDFLVPKDACLQAIILLAKLK